MLIEALVCLAAARLAVIVLPFQRALRLGHETRGGHMAPTADRARTIARVRWAVGAAARRVPWRALCLEQALAARWMLARHAIDASVHYGLSRDGAGLAAHAWVMADDLPVIGTENADFFVELSRFPPGDAGNQDVAGGTQR